MTGAAIVRWESAQATVLAIHGAFDGSSAWALRNEMDESSARAFVVDLTHAVEACDFAAVLLAAWARQRPTRRLCFKPGGPEHVRLLRAHALELVPEGADLGPVLSSSRTQPDAPGAVA